jgi:DNA-binding IclR family transcriptional regulator
LHSVIFVELRGTFVSRTDTTQTLERGLDMLLAFSAQRAVMTISQLAEVTELPESTVYRLIRTLRHKGLIEQAAPGLYRMGLRTIPMAETARQGLEFNLLSVVRPLMFDLLQQTGETVVLCAMSGDQAVIVSALESLHPIRVTLEAGRELPLTLGAAGKVLLANLDAAARAKVIAQHGADQQGSLEAELDTIRQQGYALTEGEITPGARCIAAPVYQRRRLSASICVIGPSNRLNDEQLPRLTQLIKQVAASATEQLDRNPANV